MSHESRDFLRAQFDKIMLGFLVVYFTGFMAALLIRFPNLDQSTLQWIEKSIDMVTGALIGAVTTALAMRRSESATETVTQKPGGTTETKTESTGKTEIGAPPLPPAVEPPVLATGGFGETAKPAPPVEPKP